ncbi:hypothetical protein Rhal01_01097 [Rubritalea halochordaticola]|uniref:Uncharacterized protein n=2 Tax=Rubritalea halochordaticola TaxID=714537 RepID=A0ABP9V1H1_9BACT
MPHMIFEVLNEYRTGMHIMNKPEGWGLFTRFWGIIVLAIGLYALVSSPLGKDLIYRHLGSYISSYEMPQPKARSHTPSGRGLAAIFLNNYTLGGTLTVIGCILIFKPHKGSQRLDL